MTKFNKLFGEYHAIISYFLNIDAFNFLVLYIEVISIILMRQNIMFMMQRRSSKVKIQRKRWIQINKAIYGV